MGWNAPLQNMSNSEMCLSSLVSPKVECPSPVIIFSRDTPKRSVPMQEFETPHPIKTPSIKKPETVYEAAGNCIGLLQEVQLELEARLMQLNEWIEETDQYGQRKSQSNSLGSLVQKDPAPYASPDLAHTCEKLSARLSVSSPELKS